VDFLGTYMISLVLFFRKPGVTTTHLTMHGVWKIKKIFFAYYRFISELAFSKNHHVHILE
jgi:hypothetical protein